jgi:hypothetical protein
MGPGLRRDDSKKRPFTIEELAAGTTPERSELMEDDWPVGDELI